MKETRKIGLNIVKVALVIGVLGDVLLRAVPWGLNVLVFNLAFAGAFVWLKWRSGRERLTAATWALLGAQVFFAAMFVWRDSAELRVADSLAILAVLSVLFLPRMQIAARLAGVFQYAIAFLWASLSSIFAPAVLLSSDIDWSNMPRDGWRRHTLSALRGVAIATPLVLIFGGLFVAADAVYEGMVQRVLNIAPETMFSHIIIFSIFTWLSAGYLRGVLIKVPVAVIDAAISTESPTETHESKVDRVRAESGEHAVTLPDDRNVVEHINRSDDAEPGETGAIVEKSSSSNSAKPWSWASIDNTIIPAGLTLGAVEVGVILGLMNLLFLSFVTVQVPYLFGGMELVQSTPDFKLADYARRGFGELVAVSALVLPTLLFGHWLIRKEAAGAMRLFRVLAGVQITLLFVIMASAVQRLVLLTGNLGYGMTTVRLYPMIFMSWLAIVFVWFAVTVLRGRRQYFAWGALWSAFVVIGATHFLNPDAFIVKTNLALMRQGREFDAHYNSSLSDDSIPTLIEALPQMSLEDRCEVGSDIHYRYRELGRSFDLRSYNLSRRAAWQELFRNDGLLHQTEGCPEQFSNDQPGSSSEEERK